MTGGPTEALSQALDWDTGFFGFGVARIIPERMGQDALAKQLASLWDRGTELVYWATDPDDPETQRAASKHGAFLADRKVTYLKQVSGDQATSTAASQASIEPYRSGQTDEELYRLAVLSGRYSRFAVDARFPRLLFEGLYREWMRRSVSGDIAQAVLVSRSGTTISGMVTVSVKGGRGDIGLLAVAPEFRGHGIGRSLVRSADDWFRNRGNTQAQVVTQRANQEACRLYERCGYRLERTLNFYHIWRQR